jgi:hypothetical protein
LEASAVALNSKDVNTVCMGRHQMDLPREFEQNLGSISIFEPHGLPESGAPISVMLKAAGIEPDAFKREVDKRHAKIKELQRELTDVLKEVIHVGEDAILFRIMEIDDAYTSELHIRKGGAYIVAISDSYENTYKQAEERLLAFAANIEAAARPTQGGFCLGPVVIRGDYKGEGGRLSFRSLKTPDMRLTMSIDTYEHDSSQSLLERMTGDSSLLKRLSGNYKVLRKREFQVAGMRAQEWLGWVMLGKQADQKSYGFALETLRPSPGPMQPKIFIEFKTGKQGGMATLPDSALSDAEAIGIWDGIVKSIRERP